MSDNSFDKYKSPPDARVTITVSRDLDTVASLRTLLRQLLNHQKQCSRHAEMLATMERERQAANDTAAQITKILRSLDCDSKGNTGWDARLISLLSEMTRQEMEDDAS